MNNQFYSDFNHKSSAEEKNDNLFALNSRIHKFNTAKALNVLFELLNGNSLPSEKELSPFASEYLKENSDPAYEIGQTKDLQKMVQAVYKFMALKPDENFAKIKQSPLVRSCLAPMSASMAWGGFNLKNKLAIDTNSLNMALNKYFDPASHCPIGINLKKILEAQFKFYSSSTISINNLEESTVVDMKAAGVAMRELLQNNLGDFLNAEENKD